MLEKRFVGRTVIGGAVVALVLAALYWHRPPGFQSVADAERPSAADSGLKGVVTGAAVQAVAQADAAVPEWTRPVARKGVDAANIYARAFVLMEELTAGELDLLKKPLPELDAKTAAALFKKIQPIMELMRQAALADFCDWGFEHDIFAPMPHLEKVHSLSKVARWNAAYRFGADPDGAIEDLSTVAALGHNVSDLLIGALVADSIHSSALKLIRENAAALSDTAFDSALRLLASSNLIEDNARGFRTEAEWLDNNFLGTAAKAKQGDRSAIKQIVENGLENADSPKERERMELLFDDPKALAAELRFIKDTQMQLAESLVWPEADFQAWQAELTAKLAEHPLAAITLPVAVGVRDRVQRVRVESALLEAGLRVLHQGPEQLALVRDPISGQSFHYSATADGFELHSTLMFKDKPLSMRFVK